MTLTKELIVGWMKDERCAAPEYVPFVELCHLALANLETQEWAEAYAPGSAHTYSSENADHYRGFEAAVTVVLKKLRGPR